MLQKPLHKNIRIVSITTDNREHDKAYDKTWPYFAAGHEALLQGFSQINGIEVHVVSCTQQPMRSPDQLGPSVWFHSIHVPKLGWLRTSYQGCIRAIRRVVRELNPDLVHGHGTERECSISAAMSGRPNLVTIHGNMAAQARLTPPRFGTYLWFASRLETLTLRRTNGVLCNSTYTEGLVRSRCPKTWVVPHALRMAFFEGPPRRTPGNCVILNAGVISPRKRQLELLDLAQRLHDQGLKFELRFIGFAPNPLSNYARSFLERIKPMEAAGFARFCGPQPDSELVGCFDAASGVIHFPTEEAFGNVVIESLARNLKFFGTRTGGIVDIAQDAPGAELFAPDDFEGLSDAVGKWVRAGHPRPDGGAELIRSRYHPKVIALRHLEIYREVLSTLS